MQDTNLPSQNKGYNKKGILCKPNGDKKGKGKKMKEREWTLEELVRKAIEKKTVPDLMEFICQYMLDAGYQPSEVPIIVAQKVMIPVECERDYKRKTLTVHYETLNKESVLAVYEAIWDMLDVESFMDEYNQD